MSVATRSSLTLALSTRAVICCDRSWWATPCTASPTPVPTHGAGAPLLLKCALAGQTPVDPYCILPRQPSASVSMGDGVVSSAVGL